MEFILTGLSSSPLILPVAIFVSLIYLIILYARWHYGELEKLGIPVVKPHWLLGSTFNFRLKPVGYRDVELMRKYGPVFGIYEGREPQIYVCDPDLLRLIMVKDCSYFDAKGPVDFGDNLLNEMPDYLAPEKWRIVRSFTSPAFSSAKLRLMNHPMSESLHDFVKDLESRIATNGGKLERVAFDEILFDALTDLTLRSLFSIRDDTGRFPKLLKELSKPGGLEYPYLMAIANSFPFLFMFLPPTLLTPKSAYEFTQIMENLIASRESPHSPPDIVDLCKEQLKKLSSSSEYKRAGMTRDTVLFQAFNIFFSGQDEAALVISALIYHILTSDKKEDILDRLYSEIDNLWDDENGMPPREKLLEAEYLHACIMEALRLYPFYDAERVCTKTWHCEKYNFKIPKGMVVMAPLWAVNRNPEHFEDPETFDPERFLGENKDKMNAYAWSSFGHGPRHCTGKPLAMEVLRISCAYILKKFKFELNNHSELKFRPVGPWVFINHEPIYFDISLRE